MAVTDLNLKRHSTPINRNAARERLLVLFFPEVSSSLFSHSFMHIQIYSLMKYGGFSASLPETG